jgi:hypothetical protein
VHGEHEQELLEVHRLSAVVRSCPTLFSPPELSQAKSLNATPRKERLGAERETAIMVVLTYREEG